MVKSKMITQIIIEGCDGVGKDTINLKLWPKFNFKYRSYIRGEISDYVYAKHYNREFVATQRGLPILNVLITKSKDEIKSQIINRGIEVESELKKVDFQDTFIEAANLFMNDYHVIIVDVSGLSVDESAQLIYDKIEQYIQNNNLNNYDKEINQYNRKYWLGCQKLGKEWKVINNQPYMDGIQIMADAQLHNGSYETYSHGTIKDTLIYAYSYNNRNTITFEEFSNKKYDFSYPINSKILSRPEIHNYVSSIIDSDHTLLTGNTKYIEDHKNIYKFDKVFDEEYIDMISQAKATFYCSRDLAYLRLLTARAYEAVLANQILFVDKYTDLNCEILTEIYGEDNKTLIDALYCDETTLIQKYDAIKDNKYLVEYILYRQHLWYDKLIKELESENGVAL